MGMISTSHTCLSSSIFRIVHIHTSRRNWRIALFVLFCFVFFLIFSYRCSVDPYLFENFNTVDGDTLTARFRAFKFPETNFVLFRGTIDVCLDRCSGVSSLINTSDAFIRSVDDPHVRPLTAGRMQQRPIGFRSQTTSRIHGHF